MATWESEYRGHKIRVENSIFGERLFIDGVLASKKSNFFSSELRGRITGGDEDGQEVVAELRSGMIGVGCRVLVDGVELFRYSV